MSTATLNDTVIVNDDKPYSAEETARIKAEFQRDGYRLIPGVLTQDEVEGLRDAMDRFFDETPKWQASHNIYGTWIGVRMFEVDPIFEDMLTREPIISLVEEILGPSCHLIAQNVVRNAPGTAIDNFHADDLVIFPLPDDVPRHDARIPLPIHLLTVQIPLTDLPSIEYGPSEFVPGSHYSGREPNDRKNPTFEGNGGVPIFCNAGDIYLHNGQCWHRGAPNTSDRTRYLLQLAYSKRWVSQRLYPFVNYQIPQHVVDRADDRRKRVLGFHPKGPYG